METTAIKPATVELTGNLGGEVNYKELANGKKVANFSIAENKDGKAHWHNVTLWDQRAEMAKSLEKGDLVALKGYFKPDVWKDKEGNEKSKEVFTASEIVVKSKKKDRDAFVTVKGNIGKDVEVKTLPSGKKVANLSLSDKDGKWHDVTLWNEKTEEVKNWKQGDFVEIKGKSEMREYTNKENLKIQKPEVIGFAGKMISTKLGRENKKAIGKEMGHEQKKVAGVKNVSAPVKKVAIKKSKSKGMSM